MTDQQPLVGVLIGPDESPDIRTDQDSPPRGTREIEYACLSCLCVLVHNIIILNYYYYII